MLEHKGTKEIVTHRLLLRRFNLNDAVDMFCNWANDDEVTKYLAWSSHENIETTKQVIANWIGSYDSMETYHWAIFPSDFKKPIGSISVTALSDKNEKCEVGYCISRRFWGKGYVTEALKAVISFLFEDIGFERIAAFHHIENTASAKVMLKAGMKYEGRIRKYIKNNCGEFKDCDLYSIIKEEYFNNKSSI
jgi:ribosomal-protein-alanine N-acetyltransferase